MKTKINEKEVCPDKDLKQEEGWNRMKVQWLCTEKTMGSKHTVMGRTVFPPKGASHELHIHENAEEVLYVVSGHGRAITGDETFEIGPGDVIFAGVGIPHYFENTDETEEMVTIWVYGGVGSLEASGYKQVEGAL